MSFRGSMLYFLHQSLNFTGVLKSSIAFSSTIHQQGLKSPDGLEHMGPGGALQNVCSRS